MSESCDIDTVEQQYTEEEPVKRRPFWRRLWRVVWKTALCLALLPLLLYSLIIFVDSSIRNRSLWVGLLSIPAAFVQLMGYGFGFIESWWKRCILKKDEFQAFERTFYK